MKTNLRRSKIKTVNHQKRLKKKKGLKSKVSMMSTCVSI